MISPRPTADPDVVDAANRHRYEIRSGTTLAGFALYEISGEELTFTHTEIDPEFDGKGLGARLARAALDDVRTRGLGVVPLCPFIAGWIRRHPDYADLVDDRHCHRVEPT